MDRGRSRRNSNNNVSNTDGGLGPVTMSEDESLSGAGGGGDTLTDPDPFAVFAIDFTVPPPLETSKSTTVAKSMGVRRENRSRNFEDYVYI